MSDKMSHKQVHALVNCLVDEGIKPLVDALNTWPELLTVDSCQGALDEWKKAHVHFTSTDVDNLYGLCCRMALVLQERLDMRSGEWSLSMVWFTSDTPLATLEVVP